MHTIKTLLSVAALLSIAGCALLQPGPNYAELVKQMMDGSFRKEGIANTDRLIQDQANAACSEAQGANPPDAVVEAIQQAALKSVRMPSDGKFTGDWREGEKLAQNGRGMTWTDKTALPKDNGGNCLDPESPEARPIVEYTWTKIYNAKAYNACSGMPRFGHAGLLDEKQMKHLMALLLDPKSPVNR